MNERERDLARRALQRLTVTDEDRATLAAAGITGDERTIPLYVDPDPDRPPQFRRWSNDLAAAIRKVFPAIVIFKVVYDGNERP